MATSDPAAGEYSRTIPGDCCPQAPHDGKSRGKRDTRSAVGHGYPHLWRVVWSGEKPCKSRDIGGVGHAAKSSLRAASDAAMLAHPETLTRSVQTSVEQQIELTADSLWTRRRGSAARSAQRHDLPDLVRRGQRGRDRRRRLCGRRAERLHARVDRGALPRPDPRGRARLGRRRSARAAARRRGARPAGAAARLRSAVVRDAAPARDRRRAAAGREPRHQPAATPSTRS